MSCTCGNQLSFAQCCGPLLAGERTPATAEQLMRSRYSAYAHGKLDYLERTQLGPFDRAAAKSWSARARWLGLTIVGSERGGPDDDEGVVEFVARFVEGAQTRVHRERSRFRRVDERWLYLVDGAIEAAKPQQRSTPKVGRNAPCPCGSGRKYKRCCGRT